ncbi:hypothetical protein [Burkholderia cepacia]|uniref:hypothetical protein n=1 Tax=Burkholderia cepacia TaxID=292 RepID=UPI002FE31FCF
MTLNLSNSRIVIVIRSSHRSLRRWIPSGRSAYDGSKSGHYNLAATNQKMIISIMWGAFDSRAFFQLDAFKPDKTLPCGPK